MTPRSLLSSALNIPLIPFQGTARPFPGNIQDSASDLGLELDENPVRAVSSPDSFIFFKVPSNRVTPSLFASRANSGKLMENPISKVLVAEGGVIYHQAAVTLLSLPNATQTIKGKTAILILLRDIILKIK